MPSDFGEGHALLFLDFDGVVCDSEGECFASSWLTWHEHFSPPAPEHVGRALRQRFHELRPLISSGEDYVLIQQVLAEERLSGVTFPANQVAFDDARRATGGDRMTTFKSALADTRARFLTDRKAEWLRLNPLYPHVRSLLLEAADLNRIRILSTKAPQLIEHILGAAGLSMVPGSVMHASSRPGGEDERKLDLIAGELERTGYAAAAFVEDQFEHLTGPCAFAVRRLLCDWGYALPAVVANAELLAREHVHRISADQLPALLQPITG